MKKILNTIICLSAFLLITTSCEHDKNYRSPVSGRQGEVVVVAPNAAWNGNLGDTVRETLGQYDNVLPQSERKFKIMHVAPSDFGDVYQIHRNILIINIGGEVKDNDVTKSTNVWARPQTVVYLSGKTPQDAMEQLRTKGNRIVEIFENADIQRAKQNAMDYENANLREIVEKKYGYSMYFPQEYDLLGDKDDFFWGGIKTNKSTKGVMIYSYPYTDTLQLKPASIIEKRDEILKTYMLLDKEPQGSAYMQTSDDIDIDSKILTIDNQYFVRIRGLWRMANDFMGGPFILYATVNPEKTKIVVFDGFVYSPGTEKLNLLRQIEGIILTEKPFKPTENKAEEIKK